MPTTLSHYGVPTLDMQGHYVPEKGTVWFVDPKNGSDSYNGRSPTVGHGSGGPKATMGGVLTNTLPDPDTGVSSLQDGDYIFLAPGDYNENVIFTNLHLHIIGTGPGVRIKPAAAATKVVTTILGEAASTSTGMVIIGRNCEIANLGFQCSSTTDICLYIGDGGRVTHTPALSGNPHNAWVHNCYFDGNGVGLIGIALDGMGPGTIIRDCMFYHFNSGSATAGACITLSSGLTLDQVGAWIHRNVFSGYKSYGIHRETASVCYGNIYAENFFTDQNALAGTDAILLGTGTVVDTISGNWFGCANTFVAQATDFQSGNLKNIAGTTVSYVSMA